MEGTLPEYLKQKLECDAARKDGTARDNLREVVNNGMVWNNGKLCFSEDHPMFQEMKTNSKSEYSNCYHAGVGPSDETAFAFVGSHAPLQTDNK